MKKWSVVLLLVLTLVGKLFSFESNKDLYIIYHDAYEAEDDEIMKMAYDERKFVLFVSKMSFEDFLQLYLKRIQRNCTNDYQSFYV